MLILASKISLPELRIASVISSGPKKKTIFWILTILGNQTVLKYYASYGASSGQTKNLPVHVSNDVTSITVDVEYNTNHLFKIQVETQGGKSKTASKWLSQLGTPIYKCRHTVLCKDYRHAGINICLTLLQEINQLFTNVVMDNTHVVTTKTMQSLSFKWYI